MVNVGRALVEAQVGDREVRRARQVVEIDPSDGVSLLLAGLATIHAGQWPEARTILERAAGLLEGKTMWGVLARGFLACTAGQHEGARSAAREPLCEPLGRVDEQFSWMLSGLLATAGDHDGALHWLENAVRRGFTNHRFLAERDMLLAPLRDDPRFKQLMDEARRLSSSSEG